MLLKHKREESQSNAGEKRITGPVLGTGTAVGCCGLPAAAQAAAPLQLTLPPSLSQELSSSLTPGSGRLP